MSASTGPDSGGSEPESLPSESLPSESGASEPQKTTRPASALGCYLVVVDDSGEFEAALRFACRRSVQLGARVSLLRVIEPVEAQVWFATEDLVREERVAEAEAAMQAAADTVMKVTGQMATLIIREGNTLEVLKELNDDDDFEIMSLVLASGSAESPGALMNKVPQFAPMMKFVTVIIPYSQPVQESDERVEDEAKD